MGGKTNIVTTSNDDTTQKPTIQLLHTIPEEDNQTKEVTRDSHPNNAHGTSDFEKKPPSF